MSRSHESSWPVFSNRGRRPHHDEHTPQSQANSTRHGSPEELSTFNTKYKFKVKVFYGDITLVQTDAVATGEGINPGNTSRVTEQLHKKIGENFQKMRDTVFMVHGVKEGGAYVNKLPIIPGNTEAYKWIIHAIVPDSSTPSWETTMTHLYSNVCRESDKTGIRSLSVPLLGTGNEDVNMERAILSLARGLKQFGETRQGNSLNLLQIVTLDKSLANHIGRIIKDEFSGYSTSQAETKESYQTARNTHQHYPAGTQYAHRMDQSYDRGRYVDHDQVDQDSAAYREKQYKQNWAEDNQSKRQSHNYSKDTPVDHDLQNKSTQSQGRDKTKGDDSQKKSPKSHTDIDKPAGQDICPICMDKIKDPKTLSKCHHVFCRDCIDTSFNTYKPVCPSCQTVYGKITGNMPRGNMDIEKSRESLPGYPDCGTIIIRYYFSDGKQKSEHPNPGSRYRGTTRTAFLPDNTEGQKVLKMLKVAWERRLTFTIGRSTTTGKDNVVTWNDIHHKTSKTGGEANFGYPDQTYLTRVTEELADRGITEEDIATN